MQNALDILGVISVGKQYIYDVIMIYRKYFFPLQTCIREVVHTCCIVAY